MKKIFIFSILALIVSTTDSFSQNYGSQSASFSFSSNYEHGFDTDIDDGGEISVDRFSIDGSVSKRLNEKTELTFSADYSHTDFDFSGSEGFAGLDPWDQINKYGLGMRINYNLNRNWVLTGGAFIKHAGEDGADFDDSLRYSGFGGFTYAPSRDFMIGTGLFITSRFEENVGVYPGLVLNWNINDRFRLSSLFTGVKSELGPRVQLSYDLGGGFHTGISVGYEFSSFRLDDEGIAPDGVGDVKILPIWASLGYEMNESISFEAYSGLGFFGELELEDSDGDEIAEEDFDTMFFAGGGVKIKL